MQEQERTGDKQRSQFQPGQSGNPAGRPKAHKTLSRTIQEMVNDPSFERPQSTPLQAIVALAIHEAMDSEAEAEARQNAREWIAVHGYGGDR